MQTYRTHLLWLLSNLDKRPTPTLAQESDLPHTHFAMDITTSLLCITRKNKPKIVIQAGVKAHRKVRTKLSNMTNIGISIFGCLTQES